MGVRKSQVILCFSVAITCLVIAAITFWYALHSAIALYRGSDDPIPDRSIVELSHEEVPLQTEPGTDLLGLLEEEVEQEGAENPYCGIELTQGEKELLARMVYSEARSEPFEGQVAVVQVALNRYMHEAFNGSISEILLAPNQFSVGKTYGEEQMEAVEAALAGEPALDLNTEVVFFSTGKLTYGSYYKTIGGHVFRTYS